MKIKVVCIFILVICVKMYSQDTICFTNNAKKAAIIKKISSKEVEYLKYNNPNGLVIIENKSVIKYIRYQDGSIDSIKVHPTPASTQYYEFETYNEKLFLERNNLIYKYVTLNNKNLKILINNYPFETSKKELNLKYKEVGKQKYFSFLFGLSASGAAYIGLLGMGIYENSKTHSTEGTIFFLSVGSVLSGSIFFYFKFRKKEINAKKDLVRIYNQMK